VGLRRFLLLHRHSKQCAVSRSLLLILFAQILHYVDQIAKMLKVGGYWINFGQFLDYESNQFDL